MKVLENHIVAADGYKVTATFATNASANWIGLRLSHDGRQCCEWLCAYHFPLAEIHRFLSEAVERGYLSALTAERVLGLLRESLAERGVAA